MSSVEIFGFSVSAWLIIPVIYLVWVTLLLFIKRLLFRTIQGFAQKTKTHIDNVFVESAEFPLTLLILASGGVIAEQMMPLVGQESTRYFLVGFKAVTILAVIMFVDRFLNSLLKEYGPKVEILKTSGGILRGIVRAVVICLGVLILLDSFGVSITPILASLGIGSLAVALALQPTLENFFAGVQIIVDKPIQEGHFVKLESGEEGYVRKIGWRSSWVQMLPNQVVVISNKNLVNSRVINYYYPDKEIAVLVEVGVHYQSNLEDVERVTVEVAQQTLKEVQGGVASFNPFIRYHTFDDFSINFTVILRVQEFVDNYLIKHEFIKRLHRRYQKEGIVIPYPIRAVNYDQEKATTKGI
ncbi:MAG: mechanosensitive ion channel family protein [Candidatus Omnitrophica bacterium]|nr:mechanosensitive ion channel family protein [Candidatus Omnitrophota bacterium]